MANVIPADLQLDLILDSALRAFKQLVTPLAMLSTVFRSVPLKGTNKVLVPYYPLETSASIDFNGSYQFPNGSSFETREVTVNKRKYQPLSFTSEELNRQPYFDPERVGALKGEKLALDVLADIFSIVTTANYGAAIFTGAASDFDVDDTIDMKQALTIAKWPATGRGIIIDPTYTGGLAKDMNANGGIATFGRDANGAPLTFPTLNGFSFAESNIIPANGENLKGMVVAQGGSAILTAFSPITPAPAVQKQLVRYEVVTDEDSGISLEYREWGDADGDVEKRVIEANYGFDKGEAAALKRIVSA